MYRTRELNNWPSEQLVPRRQLLYFQQRNRDIKTLHWKPLTACRMTSIFGILILTFAGFIESLVPGKNILVPQVFLTFSMVYIKSDQSYNCNYEA